jgi:hypothetical protein
MSIEALQGVTPQCNRDVFPLKQEASWAKHAAVQLPTEFR